LIYTDKEPRSGVGIHATALNSSKATRMLTLKRGLTSQGMAYKKKGEYDRALEFLEDARLVHNRVNDKIGEAGDLAEIGFLHRDMGKLRESERELEKSLKLFREERNREGEAKVLGYLGVVYLDQRQLFKSRRASWDAYRIHVEMKYFKGKAEQLVLALIDREKGNLKGTRSDDGLMSMTPPSDELDGPHERMSRLIHMTRRLRSPPIFH
jgi:tetratricopeptide (TPR) repeat protein